MKKLFCLVLLSVGVYAQPLPRDISKGIKTDALLDFLQAWENSSVHEPHSIMVVQQGKVVVEGWWRPFRKENLHTLYSVSKSFTATAVGFAVQEGLLKLDDPLMKYFPEEMPQKPSENLQKLRIRDLLTMSSGHEKEPIHIVGEEDWVKAFLHTEFPNVPGKRFLYNSPATYMLAALVQKVSGQPVVSYLKPRLFEPLGISGMDWEVDPKDINVGGWGLRLKTEDLAKFGLLFLQKGKWKGKQLLDPQWVAEASAAQVQQSVGVTEQLKTSSDWYQGYGFQMWRGRNNSFRADGAYGQNIIVLQDLDAVIVTTGESKDLQGLLNLIWDRLLPALQPGKTNKKVQVKRMENLNLAPLKGIEKVENRGLVFLKGGLEGLNLSWDKDVLNVQFETDSVTHTLPFGNGKWIESRTSMKPPHIFPGIRTRREVIPMHAVAGSYAWVDSVTLKLAMKYTENIHTRYITVRFGEKDSEVSIESVTGAKLNLVGLPDKRTATSPRLIIRGDDMGYAHSGNRALLHASVSGMQKSIEVLVTAPWYPEAAKMLQDHPRIDVGLHFSLSSEWDLVKWRPLTAAKSLRDERGYFFPMIFKNARYPGQSLSEQKYILSEIEAELRAQIEVLKRDIPRVSHVSGHMGVTVLSPEVKAMVKKVAGEYGLAVVDADAPQEYGIQYLWLMDRSLPREPAFLKMLNTLKDGETYVFLEHPGFDESELRAIHHIGYENVAVDRQDVTELFTSEKVKRALLERGVRLVSYKEVLPRK